MALKRSAGSLVLALTSLVSPVSIDSLTARQAEQPFARAEELLAAGRLDEAIRAYDAEADAGRGIRKDVLAGLATGVLERWAADSDARLVVTACQALVAAGPHRCDAVLRAYEADPTAPRVVRLQAVSSSMTAVTPAARRRLAALTDELSDREWTALVDGTASLPLPLRLEVLDRALGTDLPDIQYSALESLSRIDDPSALPILKRWAGRRSTPGSLLALAAVARSGDAQALADIRLLLPDLQGEDLLAAGVALSHQGDKQGIEIVQGVVTGPDELLQLRAAAALSDLGQAYGLRRLEDELFNANPWIRLRALEYLQGRLQEPVPGVWRLLLDDLPWIQIQAAKVLLATSAAAVAPKP